MKPNILIRIAAFLTMVFGIAHTLARPWTPAHGAAETAVVAAMNDVQFMALGSMRSYWDFYQGFGIALSGLFGVQAVLMWQLAVLAREGGRYKVAVIAHIVGFLFIGVVAANYLFMMLMWFAVTIAAVLALSLVFRTNKRVTEKAATPEAWHAVDTKSTC